MDETEINSLHGLVMPYGVRSGSELAQVMPNGTKPLPEPMLTYHQWDSEVLTYDQFQR